MSKAKSITKIITAFVMLTILGGCAASQARVSKGTTFAAAGIYYLDALPTILDESFALTVAANNHQLLLAREELNEEERIDALSNADAELKQRRALLQDIRQDLLLLRTYFIALQTLLARDNASDISSIARSVVDGLAEIRPRIENATIGGANVADFLDGSITMVVGAYQNAALKNELNARGAAIEKELALQKELLSALADEMFDNAELIVLIEEQNPIFEEFVTANRVSAKWNNKRISAFQRSVQLESFVAIKKAAANMHSSWVALVENRSSDATLDLLLQDIEQLLAVARLFEAAE